MARPSPSPIDPPSQPSPSLHWQPRHTVGATASFAAAVICGYVAAVFVLPRLPPFPPPALRAASAAHNAALLALSAAMAAGCALSTAAIFFWARVFYLSKVYELGGALLTLLAMCYLRLATRQSLMPIALVTKTVAASIGSRFFQDSHDHCE